MNIVRLTEFAAWLPLGVAACGGFFADLMDALGFVEIDVASPLASVGLPGLHLKGAARADHRPAIRVLHYMGTNFGMTGVETFILQLTRAQMRRGLAPAIAMELSDRQDVLKIASERGIAVYDLPGRQAFLSILPQKVATALLRTRRIRFLYNLLKENDVLHVQAVGLSCLDGFLAAALAGKPVIVTHHGTLSWFAAQRDRLADVTFWIEKKIASTIVMPYKAALAELNSEGVSAARSSVIPFCVDEQLFASASMPSTEDNFRLALVARMVSGKGHIELLNALSKLAPRHPKLRAMFIGDGPTRGQIEDKIDRLGLRQIVECKGKVDHRAVPALVRSAQVIVLPTYEPGEMYPLCLLEGMALGLPAIGTRWSGIPDIIDDGVSGIIVEPRDEGGLEKAIEHFITDTGFLTRASKAASARVRSRFTASIVADSYTDLYREAMSSRVRVTSHHIRIRPPRKLS